MFRALIWAAAIALAPAIAAAAQEPVPYEVLERTLEAREMELADAIGAKDREAIEALVVPEFRLRRDPDLDRAAWVAEILRLCGGGFTEVHASEVLPIGDSVLVTLAVTIYRDPACQPTSTKAVVTDVWINRDGAWRLSLRHMGTAEGITAREAPLAPPTPEPRQWAGSAELSMLSTGGNVNTQSLGFAGEFLWQQGPWRFNARTGFVRTTTEGVERARSFNVEVRQSRALRPWLDMFGRALYQRDLFAGMLHRYGGDAGLGVRRTLKGQSLEITLGAGSTREQRLTGRDGTFPGGTAGVHYRWAVTPAMTVTDDVTYSTSLNNVDNWRGENTASVSASLMHPFSLKLSFSTKYSSQPVQGFKRTDTVLSAAVVARF